MHSSRFEFETRSNIDYSKVANLRRLVRVDLFAGCRGMHRDEVDICNYRNVDRVVAKLIYGLKRGPTSTTIRDYYAR